MFRLKNIGFSLVLIASVLVIFSCGDDDPPSTECITTNITYDNTVEDIIAGSCFGSGCHDQGTTSTFEMYNYETTKAAVGFGKFVGAINHTPGFAKMPKEGDKLSDCNINKLEAWIAADFPE